MSVNYYDQITGAITNIEEAKSSIANAIAAKGVTVSSDASLGDYAALIASIPAGGGITPTGTLNISANGIYDVSIYADVSVNVPTGGGDSSTRYGIKAQMQSFSDENQGLFITNYVPTGTTTVCVNLVIDKSEEASTNVFFGCDSSDANDNIFKVWRDDTYLYFDRKNDGSERTSWEIDDTWYDFAFGNNFIRHYGEVKAEDSSYNVSWTASGPLAFGGIVDCSSGNASEYAKSGAHFEWIEIYELTGNSEEYDHEEYGKKMRRYVTAYDASNNFCLYDEIAQSFLYPTGTIDGQPETKEDPYIYELNDSSTSPAPTPDPSSGDSSSNLVLSIDSSSDSGTAYFVFNVSGSGSHGDVICTVYSSNEYTAQYAAEMEVQQENFNEDTFNEVYFSQHSYDCSIGVQQSANGNFDNMDTDAIIINGLLMDENNENAITIDGDNISTDTYVYVEDPNESK